MMIGGVEHLSVDVELKLNRRGVSYPHRARTFVSLEVAEDGLPHVARPLYPEEDLQVQATLGAEPADPAHVSDVLVLVAEGGESIEGQGCIP